MTEQSNELVDKEIVCKDCNKTFTFTTGEQEFYKEKGFTNEPARCQDCRRAKKNANRDNNNSWR